MPCEEGGADELTMKQYLEIGHNRTTRKKVGESEIAVFRRIVLSRKVDCGVGSRVANLKR